MKTIQLKKFFILVSVFIGVYLLVALVMWLIINISYFSQKEMTIKKYVDNHTNELQTSIFTKAYLMAKECQNPAFSVLQQECEGQVSRYMALHITEEDLSFRNGHEWSSWPHDLFFVKQIGGRYQKLGWSGRLEDITDKVDSKLLHSKSPKLIGYITRNCHYFYQYDQLMCDAVVPVTLKDSNENGFMVAGLTTTEEENDYFVILFMPLITMQYVWMVPSMNDQILILSQDFIMIFGPLAAVYFVNKRLLHAKKRK